MSLPRPSLDLCPGHQGRDVRCRALLSSTALGLAEVDVTEQLQSTVSYGCSFKSSNDELNILPCLGHPRVHTDGKGQPYPHPSLG